MSGTPGPAPLKYSDYLAGAAIVTGILGSATFASDLTGVISGGAILAIVGVSGVLTTIFVSLSQWLQSKGD